jgi:hypothetical protein
VQPRRFPCSTQRACSQAVRSCVKSGNVLQEPDEQNFTAQQLQLRSDLALVIPFRANNFMSHCAAQSPASEWSTAMHCASAAASQVFTEVCMIPVGTGFDVRISGRIKSLYSTHRKMQHKGVPMEQVRRPSFDLADALYGQQGAHIC